MNRSWKKDSPADKIIGLVFVLAYTCLLSMSLSCTKADDPIPPNQDTTPAVTVPKFASQWVPSSDRSRNAISRVAPSLIRDLRAEGLAYGSPVFMRIFKEERELELWVRKDNTFQLFRTYEIVAMSGHLGPKQQKGDHQAPEGFYSVTSSRMNPNSRFHLSFNLGYPNAYDRAHHRTGSALMVHGDQVSIGCYAMTDPKIEEIYCLADAALRNGQEHFQVHCFPFRMTEENMERHRQPEWFSFWQNLKTGYDLFEENKHPPDVQVHDREYIFTSPEG